MAGGVGEPAGPGCRRPGPERSGWRRFLHSTPAGAHCVRPRWSAGGRSR